MPCNHSPLCNCGGCNCRNCNDAYQRFRGILQERESRGTKTAQSVRVETTLTNEMIAEGAAEEAWGQIVRWSLAKKIQGNLTYEEVRQVYEPLFLEAIRKGIELAKVAQ